MRRLQSIDENGHAEKTEDRRAVFGLFDLAGMGFPRRCRRPGIDMRDAVRGTRIAGAATRTFNHAIWKAGAQSVHAVEEALFDIAWAVSGSRLSAVLAAAGTFAVLVEPPGDRFTVARIGPGEQQCVERPLSPRVFSVSVTVDPDNAVAERDELNNVRTDHINNPTVPATCSATATATGTPPPRNKTITPTRTQTPHDTLGPMPLP